LDLRKKSSEEYAQDKRDKMSDEDEKQLSIEEATKDVEMKPTESEATEVAEAEKESERVRKTKAKGKGRKGKQLAVEER
jgi:hypothetical protein